MISAPRALVVLAPGAVGPGAAIQSFLETEKLSLADVDFASGPTTSQLRSGYSSCLTTCSTSEQQTREVLGSVAKIVAPGARIYVADSVSLQDASKVAALQKELLLSGFADSQLVSVSGTHLLLAKKPEWDLGAKSSLSLKRAPAAPAAAPAPAAWSINPNDDGEEGDELMDEDELLTEEDKAAGPKADDCEVGASGRKACKNCSCGRAEAEQEGVKLTQDMLDNPASACGNCYLGDAFRCGSCPYRGLPAFQPGTKVQLAGDLLTADA
eukprot:CAMPEP_0202891282 /NCGR_PEP_ID=MMETSP1392-20130828/1381_1 /ASSEMBLY_ACC=CAM_ASM_000868 /TAXON_ID=225041 /ORGANISM="Chlamydomonas chlamydogama, Strain SAG 11-48b" /LENGTH=268 /DNA_ID=CAMNT_0049574985 /DNA_START=29 /DNA_END=835 /DNA_ORIENTATION=+